MPDPTIEAACPIDSSLQSAGMAPSAVDEGAVTPLWTLPVEPTGAFRHSALARVYETNPSGGEATEVTLQGLLGNGSALDGEFVRAGSDRLDGIGVAAKAIDGAFTFAPDTTEAVHCMVDLAECPAFDAVNVYYHVDRFAREFWEQRMGLDIDFQAQARVHVAGDGGFADWTTRSMKLGVGSIFMKNGALSDDLIYHEYSHLVMASLGFEIGIGNADEPRALHEAYADYFTATWTDDPRIAEWLVTCPPRAHCQGPVNATDLRTLELNPEEWNWRRGSPLSTLRYGSCTRFHEGDRKCKQSWNNASNLYVWAMIWAATLWDVRSATGPDKADQIILETARQHTAQTHFEEASATLLDTAFRLFGAAVADQVRSVLLRRGFAVATVTDTDGRPAPRERPEKGRMELWPNPALSTIRLRLDTRTSGYPIYWAVEDMVGRLLLQGREGPIGEWSVDISRLPPGVYRMRVQDGRVLRTVPFVVAF